MLLGLAACAVARAEEHAIPWASPLQSGPLRALFILPRFTQLDAADLAARLELKPTICTVWTSHRLGCDPALMPNLPAGSSEAEVAGALEKALDEKYDVIFLGRLKLDILPGSVQTKLAEAVRAGAGLVAAYIHRGETAGPLAALWDEAAKDDAPDLYRGLASLAVHGLAEAGAANPQNLRGFTDAVQARHNAKGRIVWMDFPGDPPRTHALLPVASEFVIAPETFRENAFALLARAALWSAHRDPAARIDQLIDIGPKMPTDEEVPPDIPKEYSDAVRQPAMAHTSRPFLIRLAEPAKEDYAVSMRVRKPEGGTVLSYTGKKPLPAGAKEYPVELISGPGVYFVDAELRGRKGVADWFTTLVSVPGWPRFTDLKLSKETVLPNDTVTLSLKVPPIFNKQRTCMLYARALDSFRAAPADTDRSNDLGRGAALSYAGLEGRLVAEASLAVGNEGGDLTLDLHVADLLAPLLKIEIFAAEGPLHPIGPLEQITAFYECRYVPVRRIQPASGPRFAVMGSAFDEANARFLLDRLAGAGVDSAYGAGDTVALWNAAALGLSFVPELSHVSAERAGSGLSRVPCLTEAGYRASMEKALQAAAVSQAAGGSGRYSIGNRNVLCASDENVCQSPSCLDAFRAALQKAYPSVQALNNAWGSGFDRWEDVRPPQPDRLLEAQRLGGWIDFRCAMDSVFSGFLSFAAQQVRAADPQAKVGFGLRGEEGASCGYDWQQLPALADFLLSPPNPARMAAWRSFKREGSALAILAGSEPSLERPETARWMAWHAAFNGASELCCETPFGTAEYAPRWTALEPDGSLSPGFAALAATTAELKHGLGPLLLRARRVPAATALYDSPESRHLDALDPRYATSVAQAQQAFAAWMDAAGFAYDVVGRNEARAGQLNRYRVIVLPQVRALSPEEARALRAFTEAGGFLLADVAPGVWTSHGERCAPSLDDVFGVKHGPDPETVAEVLPASATEVAVHCDTAITAAGAEASASANGTPLRLRAAKTLLLNHPLALGYQGNPCTPAISALLETAGCRPLVAVKTEKNTVFSGARFAYTMDGAQIDAVLAAPDASEKAQRIRLEYDKKAVVYDLRLGERVTHPENIKVELLPGEAACFAVLPEAVAEMKAEITGGAVAGKRLEVACLIATEKQRIAQRPVQIYLEDPAHRIMPYYVQTLDATRGAARTYFPLAINEVPGNYAVVARDLLSGQETRTRVFIGGRAQ